METSKGKPIPSPQFENIFGPENILAMTPEEKNVDIWAAFSNDDYLPQEPEQKQALGKYSLVQPRGKELSQDKAALVDTYSKYAYPEDCGEDW